MRKILTLLIMLCVALFPQLVIAETEAQIIARREALGKTKPFTSVCPRSNEPTGYITVLRLWPESNEMKIAIAALQGIVNREKPQLYIGIDKSLRWLEYYSGKIWIEPDVPNIWDVYENFKSYPKGIVVYDWSIDALANIAITYAGVEDLIPATPELAETLKEKYGWQVVHDLRGKFSTRYEAYKWAYDNLFPKCSPFMLTHYNHGMKFEDDPSGPNSPTQKTGFMVDYSVEFKAFAWHTPKDPTPEEMALTVKILESVPFHTPILGRSATQDTYNEPGFVSLVSRYGNLHIPAGMPNISVLSGVQLPAEMLKQKPLSQVRDYGPDKIYITFTTSEHDNLEHVIGGGHPWSRSDMTTDDARRIWWNDPLRGNIPLGWPVGPLISELAPTNLAYMNMTATENDCLMAALSGLSLSDMDAYGNAYPTIQDNLRDKYCQMTGDYMKKLGWTCVQPHSSPSALLPFTKNIPELEGIIEGYGPHNGITPENANYTLNGVPVFHSLTEGTAFTGRQRPLYTENVRKAGIFSKEIRNLNITDRPGFVHAWALGWDYGPTVLKMVAESLPSEYVIVRPDEMAALYKKYKGADAALTTTHPAITPVGTVTETANGSNGIIVDTGKIKVEVGWGREPQAAIKRFMGVDGKWRGGGRILINNIGDHKITEFKAERLASTKQLKQYRLTYKFDYGAAYWVTISAYAGKPYVLIEDSSHHIDLPSWTIDTYEGFVPDKLITNGPEKSIDYKESKSRGSMPWFRWMLFQSSRPEDNDLIGIINMDWLNWTNGSMSCWQKTPANCWFEFYHDRTGSKKFALAALDKNDKEAPRIIWNELNTK